MSLDASSLFQSSAAALSKALDAGEYTSEQLTELFLAHLPQGNTRLNALIRMTGDVALAQARRADARRAQGARGGMLGVPLVHKDLFCVEGVHTTCGSRMLAEWVAPYSATVVQKLEEAGAVMLGKANMDEFAMGSSNETSYFGAVHNPWDTACVPGGSSGGSAAAVASGMAPIATGTDTGGSIRQPASFCGVTGVKPTYGRVSRHGMIAFASSFDQAGVFARSAQDAAMALELICGCDERDATSVRMPPPQLSRALHAKHGGDLRGLRVGIPQEYMRDELPPASRAGIAAVADLLGDLGAVVSDCTLPAQRLAMSAYYVLTTAECSSNLARFDGVRYGHRAAEAQDMQELYQRSRAEGFGDEVKRRIVLGTFVLSSGYYDAYYVRACRARRLVQQDFKQVFSDFDLLLTPTTPSTAFSLKAIRDPVTMYLEDMMTNAVNLAGLPALSMPMPSPGLPLGAQLIANFFEEETLLSTAYLLQQHSDWHIQVPEYHLSHSHA